METTTTDTMDPFTVRHLRIDVLMKSGYNRSRVKPFPAEPTRCLLITGHPVYHRKPREAAITRHLEPVFAEDFS